jgi:peptidoglycan hydrolase-like protein with peptidoglycan-binding domain
MSGVSMLAPSIPTSGQAGHRTLRVGDRGEDVGELQQGLVAWLARTSPGRAAQFEAACNQARRAHGSPQFGPLTQAVVAEFQSRNGLGHRSLVDAATWDALARSAAGQPGTPAATPAHQTTEPSLPSPQGAMAGVHPVVLQRYQQAARTARLVVHRTGHSPHPVVERWRAVVAAYFPADAVSDALRTIFYESSGRPFVQHWNRNGSVDVGLFQMNSVHRSSYGIHTVAEWVRVMGTPHDVLATPTPAQVANNVMAAFVLFADGRGHFGRAWVAARKHGIP